MLMVQRSVLSLLRCIRFILAGMEIGFRSVLASVGFHSMYWTAGAVFRLRVFLERYVLLGQVLPLAI
ncbi:hypothetical protein D3C73_926970 [compost metagenome]